SQSDLNISAPGFQSITANLPITLNLEPKVLFTLLRQQAKSKNLPTDVIDVFINIGEIDVPGVPEIDVTKIDPDIFKNFDIIQYTKSAIGDINTTMSILADVLIGEYEFTFPMNQSGGISHTDDSIVILIQYLSKPIVSKVVNATNVEFSSVQIQKPSETGFTTIINGKISGGVPISAQFSTPNGVTVSSDRAPLGTVNLPTINIVDGVAELKDVTSQFTISDKGALSEFTQEDLHVDKISWTMTSSNITVKAFGIEIPDIAFDKKVQLNGAGGFKNAVKIDSFQLPGDDPNGGISTVISSTLTNKGTIGIELGTLFLDVIANNTKIGEVFAKDFVLEPNGDVKLNLNGRLIPQQSDEGLQIIQGIFNAFLAGEAIPLSTKGTGISPSIDWLVAAVQSLTIDTVLPPQNISNLITDVSLDELELVFTPETAYEPVTSSKKITANIQMPFGFSLNISQIAQEVVIVYDKKEMAKLVIPQNQASSDIKNGSGTVTVSYQNVPLQVFNDSHDTFNSYVKDLTIQDLIKFDLQGSSDAITFTPVGGPIKLSGIPVGVNSKLPGFQGFTVNNTPVTSIDVTNGTNETLFM
ncbi:674_t:CDS:1, partial [Gigaspora rosea]